MGFWGAVQETVIDGAAGAVGAFAPTGFAEAGAAAIHGAGSILNSVEGNHEAAGVELGSAGAAAIPSAGRVAGALDMGQAVYNAGVAGNNAAGGHADTTGEHIAHGAESLWDWM